MWAFSIGDWGVNNADPTGKTVVVDVVVFAPDGRWHLELDLWFRSVGGVVEISELAIRPGVQHDPGGVVTADLRHIPLHQISTELLRNLRRGEGPSGWEGSPLAPPQPPKGWATSLAKRPGRTGKGDLHYARVAAAYVQLLDQPKPVVLLAKRLKLSPSQVRSILYEARRPRRGLLTNPPVKGRPGGELTPKAMELLTQHEQGTEQ
jgi:hypothetical protein